jgi:parvulin-like peptidyl-prolyl isomerase
MKQSKIPILIILITVGFISIAFSEIIEKIYAVVNGEIITYSELKNAEIELTNVLRQQFPDDQLAEKIKEMKKNLLDRLIDQKIVLSVAKEKNYNVDAELEYIIKDIKKKNNISSDEELKKAIRAQGIDYDEWKKQLKETSMQHMLIREEIGSKIKIDNAEIMEYYKNNIKDFTKPMEFSLNCIYLDKEKNMDAAALSEKMQTIDSELDESNFEEVAKKYSQLPGSENNYFLGAFNEGELDAKIEEAALKIKKGERSSWIETDNGWYIIQLLNRKEPELIEYKTVRGDIENKLSAKEQNARLKEYIEQLKQESHIKIYEEFK